jgi:integrase
MAGKPGMQRKSQFGTVRKLPSGRWHGSYLTPESVRVSIGTFRLKGECHARLNEVAQALRTGTWIDPRQSARTVADVANLWLESDPNKRPNTLATDRNDVEIHIIPAMGHMALGDVSRMTIEKTVKAWTLGTGPRKIGAQPAKGRPSPRTVQRRYATLQAVFNYAQDHKWIGENVCPSSKRAKVPKVNARTTTRRFNLTPEHLAAIANAMDPKYSPMVWIAALTTMRWEECAALRVSDFDMELSTVSVRQTVIRGGAGVGPTISDPKSAASGRQNPIPMKLVEMIQEFIAARNLTGDTLLFPGASGGPMDDRWFRTRKWYPALKCADLYDTAPFRPGFHDLRRVCSTTAIHNGVDPTTLQGLMGHADSRTTMNLYPQRTTAADRAASDVVALHLLPIPA